MCECVFVVQKLESGLWEILMMTEIQRVTEYMQ